MNKAKSLSDGRERSVIGVLIGVLAVVLLISILELGFVISIIAAVFLLIVTVIMLWGRFDGFSKRSFVSKLMLSSVTCMVFLFQAIFWWWIFSCSNSDYGCGTGLEKLMGFVFVCPVAALIALFIGVVIAFSVNKVSNHGGKDKAGS